MDMEKYVHWENVALSGNVTRKRTVTQSGNILNSLIYLLFGGCKKMTRAAMLFALLVCGIMGTSTLAAYGQDTKPNIVVILADDLGNADLG